ncbi:hypothetical protein [Halorussus halobius]|uniref:hypothetical protein n=1 Tax=Halorussus halobius TaxID=1710537 RepID=UPI001B2FFA4D|nr:hypothetical protein [Halorussus halobius]
MSGDGVERAGAPGEAREDGSRDEPDDGAAPDVETTRQDLAAQVDLLAAENRRLREEYVRARRTTHRRTALGLLAVGTLAVVGALAFPDARDVLFALGATGLFGAAMTYWLTPERFVAAGTGERVYAALAATGRELVGELGLRDDRVYAPARATDESFADVRLFVPQHPDYAVPDPYRLDSLFVVDESGQRGVALPPTGGALYREFEATMAGEVRSDPGALATQLADALVEGFEVVDSARADATPAAERAARPDAAADRNAAGGRVTVAVAGSVYGPVDSFDNPVASFLGVGLAANVRRPVTTEVVAVDDGAADYLVTCEWDAEPGGRGE